MININRKIQTNTPYTNSNSTIQGELINGQAPYKNIHSSYKRLSKNKINSRSINKGKKVTKSNKTSRIKDTGHPITSNPLFSTTPTPSVGDKRKFTYYTGPLPLKKKEIRAYIHPTKEKESKRLGI